ncbi:MAG: type II CAAX endopeptidase family protein [Lacibacter sp.]
MQSKATIKKGWLRAAMFLLLYLLLTYFTATLVGLAAALVFKEATALDLFYTTICLNFLVGVLLVYFFSTAVDRQGFKNIGLQWKGFGKERLAGFTGGVLLITTIATILWLMQLLQWFTIDIPAGNLVAVSLALVLIALVEEIVFRGYVLNNLMHSMRKETALIISALLFAVFHSLNPNFSLIAFINIFIAGVMLGMNYIFSRNVWFAVFFHFSWNFFQGPVLGFGVSGIELPSLLQINIRGSILVTGGEFGLEASWLTTFVTIITSVILYLVFRSKYRLPETGSTHQ